MAAMVDSGDRKKNSILKLALFVGFGDSSDTSRPPAARSPRSFAAGDGAVGLAIVAAMSAAEEPPRSDPIPIGAVVTKPPKPRAAPAPEMGEEDMELSESYTCVISYLGGNRVKKRVYFGDGDAEGGLFLEPPPPPPQSPPSEMAEPPPRFVVADFLRCCFLCKKRLDGIDVYMYRGEKGFCSEECRCQQMLLDEFSDKLGSGAMKNYECSSSSSPCSASLNIMAGVAVA